MKRFLLCEKEDFYFTENRYYETKGFDSFGRELIIDDREKVQAWENSHTNFETTNISENTLEKAIDGGYKRKITK